MKYLVFVILLGPKLFSQDIVMPVERKIELSRTDKNFENYIFKDINNVFEKFIGKWHFEDDKFKISLQVFENFDKENRQDALLIDLNVIKDNDTIIDTLPSLIYGGVFEDKNDVNKVIVFFSEISNVWQCSNVSQVILRFDNGILNWEIDERQLRYNKSAKLFPNKIKFKR
jgi:hypothetical protein